MARKIHDLKTDPEMWEALSKGVKTAEFRRDDRGFEVGDILHLHHNGYPFGEAVLWERITHIVRGPAYGIPDGYAMLSLRTWTQADINFEEMRQRMIRCGFDPKDIPESR